MDLLASRPGEPEAEMSICWLTRQGLSAPVSWDDALGNELEEHHQHLCAVSRHPGRSVDVFALSLTLLLTWPFCSAEVHVPP